MSWIDRITNDGILRRIEKDAELIQTIKKRKLEYFGHIMKSEKFRKVIQRSSTCYASLCKERSTVKEVQEGVERLGSKISDNGLDKQWCNSFVQL